MAIVSYLKWQLESHGPVFVSRTPEGYIYRFWQNRRGTYQMYDPNLDRNKSVYGDEFRNAEEAAKAAQRSYDTLLAKGKG